MNPDGTFAPRWYPPRPMSSNASKTKTQRTIATNRRARREFAIDDTFEAGLVLLGSEVKSLREGKVQIAEGFIRLEQDEAWLVGVHIPPYEKANRNNHEPLRHRKLLLHRREIDKLIGAVSRQGFTLVPLSLYFDGSRVKLELGLGKGKKLLDKRQDERAATAKRDMDRARRGR